MNSKPFWQSKTLWVNGISFLSAILVLATTSFQFSAPVLATLLFISTSLTMLIRMIDGSPLTLK